MDLDKKEDILKKIKKDYFNINNLDNEFLEDADICLEIIKKDAYSFNFIGNDLKKDKKFLLDVISKNNKVLLYLEKDRDLMNNEEFILEACNRSNGLAFRYASYDLRNNREFIIKICTKYKEAFEYVSEELRYDKSILKEIYKIK